MRKTQAAAICLYLLLLSVPLYADDTSIFIGASSEVAPNVLIILDNSGSMEESGQDAVMIDVDYDPSYDYKSELNNPSAGYTDDRVYTRTGSGRNTTITGFPNNNTVVTVSQLGCSDAKDPKKGLPATGTWSGRIYATYPYNCCSGGGCSSQNRQLYTGHYLNWQKWVDEGHYIVTPSKTKLQIAQEVITELLNSVEEGSVNFGLMTFNTSHFSSYDWWGSGNDPQGGKLIAPIGSTHAQIISAMNAQIFCSGCYHGWTPLAETLAEAGLYFAGKKSWSQATSSSQGPTYTTPIKWRCQKNYIVIVTDGESTMDRGVNIRGENIFTNRNSSNQALNGYFGKAIGDYDKDGRDPGTLTSDGSHYLDDVAKFLYEEDLLTSGNDSAGLSFQDERYPKQNIRTFAIGFSRNTDLSFLNRVVDSSHGRGGRDDNPDAAYLASNSMELKFAFEKILGDIVTSNATFIAPVVPVSKLNRVYSGNSVYLSLFKPDATNVFWSGNIKKFGLGSDGSILQYDGTPATDENGQILSTAKSCWRLSESAPVDASTPEMGGAGAVVLNQATRKFYTYNDAGSPVTSNLTHSSNAFNTSNADAQSALGVADPSELTAYLTATGDYAKNGTKARNWVLGDILHSKPATMIHGDNIIMFAGSNDGFLHTFVDNDNGTEDDLSDDTLTEAWNFVPWSLLPNLHAIREAGSHATFVDGSPTIYDDGSYRYVAFGLRRGGDSYYSLRVGNLNASGAYTGGYDTPYFNWKIGPDLLKNNGNETLGQSWSKPLLSTIKTSSSTTNKVLLLTGGYDTNQDADVPGADTKGRAIFAVDAADGTLETSLNFNHGLTGHSDMTSCIVELAAFDYNSDGLDDTIYAGDLGGNLFVFNDRDGNGTWSKTKLFQARSAAAGTSTALLKFFYEPDISQEAFGDFVFIGTGDREHPDQNNTVNRIYAIKNTWSSSTLNETNLVDVTSYNYDVDTLADLSNNGTGADPHFGWFIKLDTNSGEKVVSSPLVYNKIVFFTTYTPSTAVASTATDECYSGGNLGVGRLYALEYNTGKAAMNLNTANDITTTDAGGNTITTEVKDASDRSTTLGVGLPSSPTLVVTKDGGAMLIIGTGGAGGTTGAQTFTIPSPSRANMYYWKQN
ncbi:MAG TPA: PilC/PilY family type IV pilus protein [Deltaproteobacteria bacterium]|nr:PilC/PilY family type IV pilus protein [Deltaproteobacteria bacterium]